MNTPTLDTYLDEDQGAQVVVVGRDGRKVATLTQADTEIVRGGDGDDIGSALDLLELSAARLFGNGDA